MKDTRDPFATLDREDERLLRRFEEFAERRELGGDVAIEELLDEDEDRRDEFLALHDALLEVEALGAAAFAEDAGALGVRRTGWRTGRRVAAAAALLVLAVAAWSWRPDPAAERAARVRAFAATVLGACEEVARGSAPTGGDRRSIATGVGVVREVAAAAGVSLGESRASLERLSGALDPAALEAPAPVGAARNAELDLVIARAADGVPEAATSPWIAPLRLPQTLHLRVIDADAASPGEVPSAWVHARYADLETGVLGPPSRLGRASDPLVLAPGDVRLIVSDDATGRFAELRVLVLPGLPIEPRLAFLRAAPAGGPMVELPPATIAYGAPESFALAMHHVARDTRVGAFSIDRHEVTNGAYLEFLRDAEGHSEWFAGGFETCRPEAPRARGAGRPVFERTGGEWTVRPDDLPRAVVGVSWRDAALYAAWAGKRLPTDREWERAGEGAVGRRYPWGGAFDGARVEASGALDALRPGPDGRLRRSAGASRATAADAWPAGGTPDGVLRLADNAREWVEDLFAYPDRSSGGAVLWPRDVGGFSLHRTVRGSSHAFLSPTTARVDARTAAVPRARLDDLGFRCARSARPHDGRSR